MSLVEGLVIGFCAAAILGMASARAGLGGFFIGVATLAACVVAAAVLTMLGITPDA